MAKVLYKTGMEVEYQGNKWTLVRYRYRDYVSGEEIWDARNSVGEVWKIYL
jgi:hypothetical protein